MPNYTTLSLESLENPIAAGPETLYETWGVYGYFREALKQARKKWKDNFAVAILGSWDEEEDEEFPEEWAFHNWIEEKVDPQGHGALIIPYQYLWVNHIVGRQVRNLTPEEGAYVAGYDPEQQLEEILNSEWYQNEKKQLFVASTPVYCYRVEREYLGDMYSMAPMPYDDLDSTTPRIPMCRKIPSCFRASGQRSPRYIYMSLEPLVTLLPSKHLVHDAPVTGERWAILPRPEVTFICVGQAQRILTKGVAKYGWMGEPTPADFVEWGKAPKFITMKHIINEAYYQVMKAEQESFGIPVKQG